MHIPQPLRRAAPLAAVTAGLVTLGFSAGGIASIDGTLASAAAEQRQSRLLVQHTATAPVDCPDRAPAPLAERWRS